MEKTKKRKVPKPVDLRIRIVPLFPEPLENGNWRFYCTVGGRGSPDLRIDAKTPKRAREILADCVYDELDRCVDQEDWDG